MHGSLSSQRAKAGPAGASRPPATVCSPDVAAGRCHSRPRRSSRAHAAAAAAADADAREPDKKMTRRAALAATLFPPLSYLSAAAPASAAPTSSLCSLLGLPAGTADDPTSSSSPSARLLYDGPGPFVAIPLPRLEHTCAPCYPASCVGDRCLQSIFVTYPRPLARAADIDEARRRETGDAGGNDGNKAAGRGGPLDSLGAPYPLVVLSAGFLMGSDSLSSIASRLATWGYVAVRYDRRDGLTDLLDDVSCAELLADLLSWCSRDPLLKRLADPSRILLVGHSRGSKVAALAMMRLQEEAAREAEEEAEAVAARRRRRAATSRGDDDEQEASPSCPAPSSEEEAKANASAEADALAATGPAVAVATPSSPAPTPSQPRRRPRVVGVVCLDPVDTTKYAPESPRFPSVLALMQQRAAAEKVAAEEPSSSSPSPSPSFSRIPWLVLGATAGADCAPAGSNYSAWFEQVPGPAVEVLVDGAGHMAFTDPGVANDAGSSSVGGGGSLARSVCSPGTADEAEVRRASMALTVAFAEGVARGSGGGVLAALAQQRCSGGDGGLDLGDASAPAAATPLASTRQALERTLGHLRGGGDSGGSGPSLGLRARWRGFA